MSSEPLMMEPGKRKYLQYGDVVRVDPTMNPQVPQPDDRRWMVISFDDRLKWTTMSIGHGLYSATTQLVTHWSTLTGFCLVEDE